MSEPIVPKQARVVIIGGGIIGASTAYHLAHRGIDVLLIERDRLTAGTTWHSAGLMVTFGSMSETSSEMRKYTRDLYASLEAETGQATGFKPVGFIEVACDADRLEEYRRVSAFNRHCGIDVQEIGPREVADLFPLAKTDDILAGFYVKEDGRTNPVDTTMALAKGAKIKGAKILEQVACTGLLTKGKTVTGVRTPYGDVEAEIVINCAGAWARQLGEASGVPIPLQAAEHYYLITDRIDGLPKNYPVLEDPGSYGYYREEGDGLMIGLFEPVCAPWKPEGLPEDFAFGEITPDWDRMGPYVEKAMKRVPITLETGVKKFFCGPESFTPDLAPILGESPELRNYFVAAGLNSIGVLTGGGIGRIMAAWVLGENPDADITGYRLDRLHPYQNNIEYRRTRTVESLGMVYQCHYPGRSMQTARGAKKSPFHDRLAERGAFFRDVSGWESPDWYAPKGVEPKIEKLSWQRQNWFPYWEAEHRAAREAVIVMDMSFMAKFIVEGRDAGELLSQLSANDVDGPPGIITYTQWLNEDGKIEADLTVSKIDDESYFVVASDTAHRTVLTRMRRHIGQRHAFVADVTSGYAQLNLQGPRSRELLAALTTADLSNDAFPFRTVREIDVGFARVRCARITYLGELGYELYIPAEQATHVYDRIVAIGDRFGLVHAGLRALSSLRMEKGYRDYGHDIDNTDHVLEAGLGFCVKLDKAGGFIGRDAVAKKKAAGPLTRRLLQVRLDEPEPLLFHGEVVYRDGKAVGYVRAASYGFSIGGAVGLFMADAAEPIDRAYVEAARWEVDVAGTRVPATVSIRPMYDPRSERIKG